MQNFKETMSYVLKRILLMLVTFIIIFIISFALIRLLPRPEAGGAGVDTQKYHMQLVATGVEKIVDGEFVKCTIPEQFFSFLKHLFAPYRYLDSVSGQWITMSPFGYSYYIEKGTDSMTLLFQKMPITVMLNVYSIIFSIPFGIALGIFMALKKNKWQDNVLNVVIMIFIAIPGFVFAFILQYLFGYKWELLPPQVYGVSEVNLFSPEMFRSMLLPIITMSLGSIAGYARYTRAELTEVLTSDFMLLARTKGLTRGQATVRHALRNSMVPIFPMILGEIISILSGSIIVENIFSINGIGGIYLQSIQMRDLEVFQFVSMFYILIGLIGGLIVDISYGIVDPRIRMGGGKNNA